MCHSERMRVFEVFLSRLFQVGVLRGSERLGGGGWCGGGVGHTGSGILCLGVGVCPERTLH